MSIITIFIVIIITIITTIIITVIITIIIIDLVIIIIIIQQRQLCSYPAVSVSLIELIHNFTLAPPYQTALMTSSSFHHPHFLIIVSS